MRNQLNNAIDRLHHTKDMVERRQPACTTSRLMVRLNSLSRDDLLELAARGCVADVELRNRADALIAQILDTLVAP